MDGTNKNLHRIKQLCTFAMTKHLGEVLHDFLKTNGFSIVRFCKVNGFHRGTLYNRFSKGDFTKDEETKVKQFLKKHK